tara:strand:+ start:557 stop:736 length:180 start_codon:yes stop_codon:yes gene_type:complete
MIKASDFPGGNYPSTTGNKSGGIGLELHYPRHPLRPTVESFVRDVSQMLGQIESQMELE